MRFLSWVIAIACMCCVADAQQRGFDARSPDANRQLTPQGAQKPEPGPRGAQFAPTNLRSLNFRGHVYHGRFSWEQGRWHHTTRKGQLGWWWDVGGVWYFYPEPIEGPPDHVSDIEVADDATGVSPSPPPDVSHHAFYYRPGDLKGVPYDTIEECTKASQQAGNVGICVMK